MYTIRPLTAQDIISYREIRLESLQRSPFAYGQSAEEFERETEESLRKRCERTSHRFTLGGFDREGSLVATVGLIREPVERYLHKGLVWGVYVKETARGTGLGRRMMEEAISEASKMEGLELLFLSVGETQEAALSLYSSIGFEVYGREPRAVRVDGTYADYLHMYRFLDLK